MYRLWRNDLHLDEHNAYYQTGNLPTEKVTKRDLFHIFHKYGKLAQVSIKQAYGFVQYLETSCCHRALHNEQGMSVRGRKMRTYLFPNIEALFRLTVA